MAVFFTSVYKHYYDSLTKAKNLLVSAMSLEEKAQELMYSTNALIKMLENSSLNEQGILYMKDVYIPMIGYDIKNLSEENIAKLKIAANKSIVELLPLLEELKTMDEEYEALKNVKEEDKDKSKIANLEVLIKNKIKEIDNKIIEIKNLDLGSHSSTTYVSASVANTGEVPNLINSIFKKGIGDTGGYQIPITQGVGSATNPPAKSGGKKRIITGPNLAAGNLIDRPGITHDGKAPVIEGVPSTSTTVNTDLANNPKLVRKSINGGNFYVVKTAYDVGSYASAARSAGIRQNSNTERYGDLCLAFSYVHASNLYTGQGGDNAESAYRWRHAGEFTDFFNDDKKATLAKIYEQITQGKPVIMQVNGNKAGTSRHFVTVVGFKDTVSGPDSLTEDDLLIMDSWDAQIERMDTPQSRFMTTGAQTRKKYTGYYLRVLKG